MDTNINIIKKKIGFKPLSGENSQTGGREKNINQHEQIFVL